MPRLLDFEREILISNWQVCEHFRLFWATYKEVLRLIEFCRSYNLMDDGEKDRVVSKTYDRIQPRVKVWVLANEINQRPEDLKRIILRYLWSLDPNDSSAAKFDDVINSDQRAWQCQKT